MPYLDPRPWSQILTDLVLHEHRVGELLLQRTQHTHDESRLILTFSDDDPTAAGVTELVISGRVLYDTVQVWHFVNLSQALEHSAQRRKQAETLIAWQLSEQTPVEDTPFAAAITEALSHTQHQIARLMRLRATTAELSTELARQIPEAADLHPGSPTLSFDFGTYWTRRDPEEVRDPMVLAYGTSTKLSLALEDAQLNHRRLEQMRERSTRPADD